MGSSIRTTRRTRLRRPRNPETSSRSSPPGSPNSPPSACKSATTRISFHSTPEKPPPPRACNRSMLPSRRASRVCSPSRSAPPPEANSTARRRTRSPCSKSGGMEATASLASLSAACYILEVETLPRLSGFESSPGAGGGRREGRVAQNPRTAGSRRAHHRGGTHPHVPTADTRILPGGTAYQTDCGMTGPYRSVIGVDTETILQRFLTGLPVRMEAAKHGVELHSVILDVDEETGKARAIRRHTINGD